MPLEKSAGAVVFLKQKRKIEYLLLRYGAGHWDFPKGNIEKGETEKSTVGREVLEETGLDKIRIVSGFRETIRYFFKKDKKTIFKTAVFYLAEAKEKRIKISREHTEYKWLPYKKAMQQLTFKNAKEILKRAHAFLLLSLTRQQQSVLVKKDVPSQQIGVKRRAYVRSFRNRKQ